jgi:cell division septum initiation protein DivIVA
LAIPLYDCLELSSSEFFDGEPSPPSFTTAIRGYQKDEVHAFLRELRQEHSEDQRERQRLEKVTKELRERVATLERNVVATTPHTIDALGERMLLILHHAEAAANDAVVAAEAHAAQVRQEAAQRAEGHVRQASLRASQAAQTLTAARAEAQRCIEETKAEVSTRREAELREAERIATELVATARSKADALMSQVQAQAATLLADARSQAETMVAEATAHAADIAAQTAEAEALARDQIGERRALADAHLLALADQRDELLAEMGHIHAALARTLRASGFEASTPDGSPTQEEKDPTQEQPAIVVNS